MRQSAASILVLFYLLIIGGLSTAPAQTFDISSGGTPTITGSIGGSVSGSASTLNDLSVIVNFGEISPLNPNSIVKVTVPIAVRSTSPYQVTAVYVGAGSTTAQDIQATDAGMGIRNFRSMGANARVCTNSSHVIASPFNIDPATSVTISSNGRAAYPATLNNIAFTTTVLSGPRLSSTTTASRQTNNGYIFDAVFAITPQFYDTGTSTATLTFTISAGPNVPC